MQLVVGTPRAAAIADDHGHGGINNHITRHMQMGDTSAGVHHSQLWAGAINFPNISLDFLTFGLREGLNLGVEFSHSIVGVHPKLSQHGRMFGQHVLVVNRHTMAENNRIGHAHHGRLQVQR